MLYMSFLEDRNTEDMHCIVNNINEVQLKELIDICKIQNQLHTLIQLLEIEKMSGFFLECQKIGDRSSILLILDQIGISSIDFGFDILLYAIENFEPAIEKIFFNLFKEAEILGSSEENKGTMFGEI